jgi:hypothetical protein
MTRAVLAAAATTAILLLGVMPSASQSQNARKLYVFQTKANQAEQQCWTVGGYAKCVAGSDDDEIGLYVIRDILSKCPGTISITSSKRDANYLLQPHYRASALYDNTNGEVLYVSPANHTGNIAKDICRFVAKQK